MNDPVAEKPAEAAPEAASEPQAAPAPRLKPSEDPNHLVVKVSSYVDNGGRQVDDREIVWGTAPEGFDRFSGVGDISFKYPNGQVKTQSTRFPLKGATTLKEAFDAYDAQFDIAHVETQKQFDEHVERMQKQIEEQQKAATKAALAQSGKPWRPPGGIIRPG